MVKLECRVLQTLRSEHGFSHDFPSLELFRELVADLEFHLGLGFLTQESGDVRRIEGEVCGAVLVDE